MKPLQSIYWLRVGLGVVAALVCTGYAIVAGVSSSEFRINTLFNGVSIALVIYLISYYPIKTLFINKVEKPQKLVTMGIGIYFITWLVFWILFYTILVGPPLIF